MDYYHKPTGQIVDQFQVQSITGLNTVTTCPENLREVGIYLIVDEIKEGVLENPEPVYEEEGGVFYRRNSCVPLELSTAKTKAMMYLANYAESEIIRLIENSGLKPITVILFYLVSKTREENKIPGLDTYTLENTVNQVLKTLHNIEKSETTEEIKQLLRETVPS